MSKRCVNADGDPSDEEFTPPLIIPKETSGVRLELLKVPSFSVLFPET